MRKLIGAANKFIDFIMGLFNDRELIFVLAKKYLKSKYLANYLGIVWAFVQPTAQLLVLWFVFEKGFNAQPVAGGERVYNYILWLIAGMIPWFFINESLTSATDSVVQESYLVKKVVFKVNILPVIRIMTGLYIHAFFIALAIGIYWLHGFAPTIYIFQIVYYLFCAIALLLGITWLTSSVVIFLRDLSPMVAVFLQVAFWATPITWNVSILNSGSLTSLLRFNPLNYIVSGYRDAFMFHVWPWERPVETLVFWSIAAALLIAGVFLFSRLRPHFADVL